MIDSFVLLAPIYLLGVIALLGFVGCSFEIGVAQDPEPIPGPVLRFTAGDGRVDLDWDAVPDATEYHVFRGESSTTRAAIGQPVMASKVTYADTDVTNGKTYNYVVSAAVITPPATTPVETAESNAVEATPLGSFVTVVTRGTANAAGRAGGFGMRIRVGSSNLTIHTVGRAFELGLSSAHVVRIIDAVSPNAELGSGSIDASSPIVGDFRYAKLVPTDTTVQHVVLTAGQAYYVLSEEFTGGDRFFEQDTTVMTKPDAVVETGIDNSAPGVFTTVGGPGHTYGPVSFQY